MKANPMLKCRPIPIVVLPVIDIVRWMGTYPELPSYVLPTGDDLQKIIDENPEELLGKSVINKFGHTQLPYLPKVLSIAKALPLQVHPVGCFSIYCPPRS